MKRKWYIHAACLLALLGCAATAHAQARLGYPGDTELLRRMETLEQQNQQNLQLIQALQAPPAPAPQVPFALSDNLDQGGQLSKQEVQKIIADYMKDKDAAAKKADDEKKKKDAETPKAVGSDLNFKATWKDGVNFATPLNDFKFHVGGRAHQDWGWFDPDAALQPRIFNDGADFRRLRLRVDGSCWEVISWVCEMEFANAVSGGTNHPVPTDVFMEINPLYAFGGFRAGHFKEPFDLEDYGTSSRYINLMERSAAHDAFSPQRNIGIMNLNYCGEQNCEWGTYGIGVFKTNSDNNSGNAFDYSDGQYAFTGRLTCCPWYEHDGRCMFHIGGAASQRTLDPDSPSGTVTFASRIPLRVGSPNVVSTGALRADNYQLYNAQVASNLGAFNMQAEYYLADANNIRRGAVATNTPRLVDGTFSGFYVQFGYFLTGEYRTYKRSTGTYDRVKVHEPFYWVRQEDCSSIWGSGAWEVVVRYDYLDTDSPALLGFTPAGGSGGTAVAAVATRGIEEDVVLGLNWYLNSNFKIMFNYIYARVDGTNVSATTQSGEIHALGTRFAFDF